LFGNSDNKNRVNRKDDVQLIATALSDTGLTPVQWEWTVASGPMNNQQLDAILLSPSRFQSTLAIAPGFLGANQSFTFMVTGTTTRGTGKSSLSGKPKLLKMIFFY